ncbi:TPA: replication initiator protein A, partial [Staphylococcus aureus]
WTMVLFNQIIQVLLYGEKYKKLSDSAKLGYVVLRDRLEYSLQNNWIDDEDRVYFIFTNQELNDLFGWGNTKISKIKKELEEAGLLFQVKQAFDPKKMKNLPNRLYLADLEVTAKDVYIKQDFANKTAETLDMSGQPQMGARLKTAETLDKSGQPQMGHNLYKTNLDTNKDTNKDTSMLDFSSTNFSQDVLQKQNQDIVANASEFLVSNGNSGKIPLEAETIKLISMGENPLIIKDRLGHEDIETTLGTYGHLYPNSNFEVANKLNGAISFKEAKQNYDTSPKNQFTVDYLRNKEMKKVQ